jgi:proteasome lid subunit RPN8/RPN11
MSSDIQFGDLEESEPQRAIRPDQDAHFATAMVGNVGDDELLIYVDLDVQRDMEAHALSNTRVELGGVMLGRQLIDDNGRPFVIISDSLRAEHYEATKGSFKFTHESWSQISRQREDFRPDLEMVGWYHTHPGWSVFLSGMDLFICNNFFNRALDVALVIDPCEQDRGWFQWTADDKPTTRRTGGFILTTGRFRQLELDQFACIYNKEPIMNMDPRYSGNVLSGSQPSVTIMENRKPVFELAVIGMLMMQFLMFSFFAWQALSPAPPVEGAGEQEKIAQLESKLELLAADQGQSMREDAYREVLTTLVANQTGDANLVDDFTKLKTEHSRMQANLEGQLALAERLKFERNSATAQLDAKTKIAEKLQSQLTGTRDLYDEVSNKYTALEGRVAKMVEDGEISLEEPATGLLSMRWWWLVIGAFVVGLLGCALGYALARREGVDDRFEPELKNSPRNEDGGVRDSAFESRDEPPGKVASPTPESNITLTIDGNSEG